MTADEAQLGREARQEAAPALALALALVVLLAIVSRIEGWELLSAVRWWVWLLVAVPELVLLADLALVGRGTATVRTRRAALVLPGILMAASLAALAVLLAALVTTSAQALGGGELLLTALVIWVTVVIVLGLWFWELDCGGPVARAIARGRATPDLQFPQDESPALAPRGWQPDVWDYLYLSLTSSIAFSPTDAMPLSRRAKGSMALGSLLSAVTVLLVAARAVNVLGA